ncbi:hypothetical protein ACQ4PT_014853 [Festuca glaucescens]
MEAPEMSTTSGTAAKRAGMPLADEEASPKRARSSSHPSLSPSPPPSKSRSVAPSPSQSRLPAYLARTPPLTPRRTSTLSPRWGSLHGYDYDPSPSISRSHSHLSEVMDGHGHVWRPHSYKEINGERGDDKYSVRISVYDRLFTCRSCQRMLSSSIYECSSGHVTCARCHGETAANVCSYCAVTGCTCSRAVEEFLYGISFSCRNQQYGCDAFLLHHQMRAHERSCHHEPCFCPVPRCGFAGQTYELSLTSPPSIARTWSSMASPENNSSQPAVSSSAVAGGAHSSSPSEQAQALARKELSLMICVHEYPLSIVDHALFRKFCKTLQPLFKMVCRNTIRKDILEMHAAQKELMVRFAYVPCPHNGEVICQALYECLVDWHLEGKALFGSLYGYEYANREVERIRNLMVDLLEEYRPVEDSGCASKHGSDAASTVGTDEALQIFSAYMSSQPVVSASLVRTELDLYLEEPNITMTTELDIIGWWKFGGIKYPTLQRMAHDILPIPVTTVASESAFSTSGRVLSAHRSSLAPNMAEALMCMQAWSRADMLGDCNSTLFAEFQSVLADEEEPMEEDVSILTEE